jgi:hypothetical protein
LARDRGGEYGHIGFCDGLCPLTLAMEASGGLESFSFSRVAGSPLLVRALLVPPCLSLPCLMSWIGTGAPQGGEPFQHRFFL